MITTTLPELPSAQCLDGMFTATDISQPELLDQCRALVFAITELTNTVARDCLIWILMERVELLRDKMDEEVIV
ncbi:hypothetical protein [Erwinia psidii]|uniref:Uncharacterized protein n=1 Tax=Erwinia psidii TaxID=69224 RepID=A0A3N6RVC0_9GAMM|nr:hypothetical protein [Erwinia psidii]MCX8959433.1 hypothetical protein [Erwinia psidii]MCX8962739.1 hypothetical protein [Erwinia psidii]MCX8964285.1 hypothetical protein [Erwinia psidii]RQM36884.1 hypothetical protein EB241_18125 [Erwinia psidii]